MKKLIILAATALLLLTACAPQKTAYEQAQEEIAKQAAEMYKDAQEQGEKMYKEIEETYNKNLEKAGGDLEKALELTNEELGLTPPEAAAPDPTPESTASAAPDPTATPIGVPSAAPEPSAAPSPDPTSVPADEPSASSDPILDDVIFSNSVRDDVTGNWRLATITVYEPTENYAADYYKEYFQSDDEIHAVINFTLGTTSRITVLNPGTLAVTVYEHVDGEEHSAKDLFTGEKLGQFWVDTDTGEIEEIE